MTVLFREVGRLSAPLRTDNLLLLPELVSVTADSMGALFSSRIEPVPRFDERLVSYYTPEPSTLVREWMDELRAERTIAHDRFVRQNPEPGELPADPAKRIAEQDRRIAERVAAEDSVGAAYHRLLNDLILAHRERIAREVAARAGAAEGITFPRPEPQPYGVSARGAEFWVRDMLRHLGVHDAEVTQQTADGGVDVVSRQLAVSVKHYAGAVPVEEVREIFGVAVAAGLTPMLWTSGRLTETAKQFADLAPVAVVTYEVETAAWTATNDAARAALRSTGHGY